MEEIRYRLVTMGEVHSGFTIQEVRKSVAALCKGDGERLERIFSGSTFVLHSDLDLVSARRLKTSLDQTGIVCLIEPLNPVVIPDAQAVQPVPSVDELTACPRCGAPFRGEEVCSACGVIPAKYLERQRLEREVRPVPVEEAKGSGGTRTSLAVLLLLVAVAAVGAAVFLPKNFRYEVSDWIARQKAPNFQHPLKEFNTLTQADFIREYTDRGFELSCYGNLRPDERVSASDDYVCWIPMGTAYSNIPARQGAFFFAGGKINHVRLDFPESSFSQIQEFLEKKLVNNPRLDTRPPYQGQTDSYGEPVLIWQVQEGVLKTSSRPTPGRKFIVLWTRTE